MRCLRRVFERFRVSVGGLVQSGLGAALRGQSQQASELKCRIAPRENLHQAGGGVNAHRASVRLHFLGNSLQGFPQNTYDLFDLFRSGHLPILTFELRQRNGPFIPVPAGGNA